MEILIIPDKKWVYKSLLLDCTHRFSHRFSDCDTLRWICSMVLFWSCRCGSRAGPSGWLSWKTQLWKSGECVDTYIYMYIYLFTQIISQFRRVFVSPWTNDGIWHFRWILWLVGPLEWTVFDEIFHRTGWHRWYTCDVDTVTTKKQWFEEANGEIFIRKNVRQALFFIRCATGDVNAGFFKGWTMPATLYFRIERSWEFATPDQNVQMKVCANVASPKP